MLGHLAQISKDRLNNKSILLPSKRNVLYGWFVVTIESGIIWKQINDSILANVLGKSLL